VFFDFVKNSAKLNLSMPTKKQPIKQIDEVNLLMDYLPPTIEILEIKVEKGFADSTDTNPWGDGSSW
jgi:hypothetical protein